MRSLVATLVLLSTVIPLTARATSGCVDVRQTLTGIVEAAIRAPLNPNCVVATIPIETASPPNPNCGGEYRSGRTEGFLFCGDSARSISRGDRVSFEAGISLDRISRPNPTAPLIADVAVIDGRTLRVISDQPGTARSPAAYYALLTLLYLVMVTGLAYRFVRRGRSGVDVTVFSALAWGSFVIATTYVLSAKGFSGENIIMLGLLCIGLAFLVYAIRNAFWRTRKTSSKAP